MNNFLSIVWYRVLPPQYGGQKGIAHFNYFLGKRVPLTCLCSRNNSSEQLTYKLINELPVSRLQFWNPATRKKILGHIRRGQFTHVIIEHPWHGWLGRYKTKYGFKLIVHAHNIEHLRLKARNKLWWGTLKNVERKAFKYADYTLFKTEVDKQTAMRLFNIPSSKCHIVPYGVPASKQMLIPDEAKARVRAKHQLHQDEKLLLFTGTLDYEPNTTAMATIIKEIIPRLKAKQFPFKVIICGEIPGSIRSVAGSVPDVVFAGYVPDVEDYLQAADVFINPVITGSGVQTKNIEAIASACNVVCTAFAAIGLPSYLFDKKLFVSADNDWEQFTDNIIRAADLSFTTPQQFYHDHNWQNIIADLLERIARHPDLVSRHATKHAVCP